MDWWLTVYVPFIASVLSVLCASSLTCLGVNVCTCLGQKVCNRWKLDENLDKLKKDLNYLIEKRDYVLRRVGAEELKGRQRQSEVAKWLLEVEAIVTNTRNLVDDAPGQDASPCGCGRGEEVVRKLNEVKSLFDKDFPEVTEQAPPLVVELQNCELPVGLQTMLEKTWESVMGNRKLGIYGMGGVGKTTLLTLINNKFDEVQVKKDFDVVIWVEVSKAADVGTIQDDIGKRLGLYDEDWCRKTQREKARDIHRVLKDTKPRSVLLLDDLWEQVSLADIGIPPLQESQYKVVLTTRFKNVCESMDVNEEIKFQCLVEKDAWDLFKKKARRGNLIDEISGISKRIAANCCGLPLALAEIGKSLAYKTTVDEWRRALETLKSYPSELKGAEKGIFQVLKSSYDYLKENDEKQCFQYCALFPKAYNMKEDELIEYWIGEGFIDAKSGRERAKRRGIDIIKTLVESSLLSKDGESGEEVYMHDMIREMALWRISKFEKAEGFFVKAGAGLGEMPGGTDWTTATKVSLMNNQIESIADVTEIPDEACLITLFLQNNVLVEIIGQFFVALSTLKVLDLSRNPRLTELPNEISNLVALKYLNLSETGIKNLPENFGKLRELIYLDLESTLNLASIGLVAGLLELQVLRFYDSAAALDLSLLKKLACLKSLKLVTVTVREAAVLTALLGSKLAGKTQGLYLQGLQVSGVSFAATFGALANLCNLGMQNCDIVESPTPSPSNQIAPRNPWLKNLSTVVLSSCQHLKDLTWLIYAENLKSLSVVSSPKMEELINKDKAAGFADEPFRNLQALRLHHLDVLRSFYWSRLSFPKLKLNEVDIVNCPELHERPLGSMNVEGIDDLCI